MSHRDPSLGIAANWPQFSLLVLINAFVGAMVGLERSVLPLIGADRFGLDSHTAILAFIAVFGISKAAANYGAGRWSDRFGRRPVMITGWLLASPVPWLLGTTDTWVWVLLANVLLGISQGLTWSAAVIMKIDLAGPRRRGLAMGLNEFSGYLAVGVLAWWTAELAVAAGAQESIFQLGIGISIAGLLLSVFALRDTQSHADMEAAASSEAPEPDVFMRTSWRDSSLSSVTQAGMVNNLNDGVAWGLFPLLFVAGGLGLTEVGWLAGLYPTVWGITQLLTGPLSDRIGRKPLMIGGMFLQAVALSAVALSTSVVHYAVAMAALGLGTAMVYPTFLAAIGDHAGPSWRAQAVGVYRSWRDLGYTVGAVMAGVVADLVGLHAAVAVTAVVTALAGVGLVRYREGS
jgi:MFS family permease